MLIHLLYYVCVPTEKDYTTRTTYCVNRNFNNNEKKKRWLRVKKRMAVCIRNAI